ncbi:Kunitz/Bovine pancreatic trypsin inhibitor domain protein, partial [Oesophagostomum dentatum]
MSSRTRAVKETETTMRVGKSAWQSVTKKEPGPCKHFVDRWFFNTEDGTCHPFKYGGCAGNRNHFFTQNECEIHCARFLHRVTAPSAMHVPESEFADAKPPPPLRTSGGLEADAERRPAPTSQRPQQNSASYAVTAPPAKSSNTARDRSSLPVTLPARTLAAANLPFEIPAHLRSGAEPPKAKGSRTFYPETYEAWGIDLNRHPELAQEPAKQKPLARAQPTLASAGTQPNINVAAKESNQEQKFRPQPLPAAVQDRPVQTRIQIKPIEQKPTSELSNGAVHRENRPTTSEPVTASPRKPAPDSAQQSRFAPELNLASSRAPAQEVSHQTPTTDSNHRELPVKPLKPLEAEARPRVQAAYEQRLPITASAAPPVPPNTEQNPANNPQAPPKLEQKPPPRQFSSPTHSRSYSTNSIKSYNPQQNNNLAGLSPPVDPTYFTYNSQHLGAAPNRQFAVNTVPLDKQFVPENNSWLQQNQLQQVQQARAMAQPMFTSVVQGRGQFEGQFVSSHPGERQAVGQALPAQSSLTRNQGRVGSAHISGQEFGGATSRSASTLSHPSEQRANGQVTPVQGLPTQSSPARGPPPTQNLQTSRSTAAQAPAQTVPVTTQFSRNEWQERNQHLPSEQGDLRVVDGSLGSRFTTSPQNTPTHNFDRERARQQPVTTSRSPVRESEGIQAQHTSTRPAPTTTVQQRQQQIERLREQNYREATRQHSTPPSPTELTPIKPQPSSQPSSQHPQPVNHRTSERRISYAEQQSSPSPHTDFPRRRIENNQMVVTSSRQTSSRIEDEIAKTKAEWATVNAREGTQNIHNQESKAAWQRIAKAEFPYGLDRSKFIYWNGDYYAPTIPGVRIPRPGQKPSAEDWTIVEGPPAEMFREFQRQSKEFQNVAPFVNAARSAVEGEKKAESKNPVDIMDKALYLKQEGSVINAPRVRVPDKRPRKLQELSEHYPITDNDFPQFLRAPPPNRTRTERPKHTLNQANPPIYNLPNDNFPNHMQVANNTFTEARSNIRRHEQRHNFSTRLNIKPIGSIAGVVTEDGDNDDNEEPEQAPRRAAGVTQTRTQAPVGADNHRAPSPSLRGVATNSVASHPAHGKKIASIPAIPVEGMMSTASMEASDERGALESRNLARTNRPPTITGQRVSRTTQRSTSTTEAPSTTTSTVTTVTTTTRATTTPVTTVTAPATVTTPTTVTSAAETTPLSSTDVTASGSVVEARRSSTTEETPSSTTAARVSESTAPSRQQFAEETPAPVYETSTVVTDAENSTEFASITEDEEGDMVDEEPTTPSSDSSSSTADYTTSSASSRTTSPYSYSSSSSSSEPSSTVATATEASEDVSVSMSESTIAPFPSMSSTTASLSTDTFASVDLSTILSASESTTVRTSLSTEYSTTSGVDSTADYVNTSAPKESSSAPIDNATTPEILPEETTEEPSTQTTAEFTTITTEAPTSTTNRATTTPIVKKPTSVVSDLTEVDFSRDEQRTSAQSRVELPSAKKEPTNLSSALARNELQLAPKPPIFTPSGTETQPLKKIEILPRIPTTDTPTTTARSTTSSTTT